MFALYKKELKAYSTSMTGAVFVGFILLIAGIFTVVYNLRGRYPGFEVVLSGISFIYMLTVPVLTMRSVAEEKHSRTDQLLYSLPIGISSVVLAKYFAMLTVLFIPCGIMAFYPLILSTFGAESLVGAYAMLLVFFLLGATLISVGMFISSLTESQIIAAVISLGVMVLLNFMPALSSLVPTTSGASFAGLIVLSIIVGIIIQVMIKNYIISVCATALLALASAAVYYLSPSTLEGFVPQALRSISLFNGLSSFQGGIFDMTTIVFYISISSLFVYLTVQSMEKKRWN